MGEPHVPGSFVGVDDETRRIRTDHRLTIRGEDCGGVRLVRVSIATGPLPQDTRRRIDNRMPRGYGARGAQVEVVRQPLDDECEPWLHADRLPDGWLDRAREGLADPKATSKGHKQTIYACRMLVDEIDRMRKEAGHD